MKPNDTRDKILRAGLSLFSEKGYLGATTKEIAKRAGVAELTLFRHFSSKDRLFEEIINSYTFLPALKGMLPEIKDLEYGKALEIIAGKFLERLSERRHLIRIMHSEIQLYPSRVKNIYHNFIDELFRTLASYFSEMQKKGILKKFKPEFGARAFLGMFFSYFNAQEFMARKKSKADDKNMVISEFVGIFVNGTANIDCQLKSRHSRAGGNPGYLKRMDSRLKISGMTTKKILKKSVKIETINQEK